MNKHFMIKENNKEKKINLFEPEIKVILKCFK